MKNKNNETNNFSDMYVLLIILFWFLICMFGCDLSPKDKQFSPDNTSMNVSNHVGKFNFENHDYLKFGNYESQSIMHNPNCSNEKCKK